MEQILSITLYKLTIIRMGIGTYLRGTAWAVPLLEVGRRQYIFAVPLFGRRE